MHFEYYIPAQYWTPPAKVICSSEIYIFQSFPVTRGGAGEPGMTDHDVYVCSLHLLFLTVPLCTVHIMFSSIFLQNGRELLRAVLQRKVFSRFWEQITFGLGSVERLTAIIWFAFIRRQFDLIPNRIALRRNIPPFSSHSYTVIQVLTLREVFNAQHLFECMIKCRWDLSWNDFPGILFNLKFSSYLLETCRI